MTTTDAPPRAFRVGDKVTVASNRYPGVWTVTKANTATCELAQAGANLKSHVSRLAHEGAPPPVGRPFSPTTFIPLGSVVTCNDPRMPGGLWVVCGQAKRVKVARLGGGGDVWNVPVGRLTVVERDWQAQA